MDSVEKNIILKNDVAQLYKIICSNELLELLNLSNRDKIVLQMRWLHNYSYAIIGKHIKVSGQMARELYIKAVKKIEEDLAALIRTLNKPIESLDIKIKDEQKIIESKTKDVSISATTQILISNIDGLNKKCKLELKYRKIETLQELTRFKPNEIISYRGFGKKSLQEIQTAMSQYNLQLASSDC